MAPGQSLLGFGLNCPIRFMWASRRNMLGFPTESSGLSGGALCTFRSILLNNVLGSPVGVMWTSIRKIQVFRTAFSGCPDEDFSASGLNSQGFEIKSSELPSEVVQSDLCRLPDGVFWAFRRSPLGFQTEYSGF